MSTNLTNKVTYSKVKNGYLYNIPIDQIERIEYCPMNGTKGETVTSAAKRIKWNNRAPDIITNAELFNMKTYAATTGVVDNGKNIYLPETHGIAFKNYKTPIFSYKNNVNASDYVGGYPTLVRNGKIGFTAIPSGLGGSRARTAIGVGKNKFGILVIPEQSGTKDATLNEIANIFIQNGYDNAINLDGGGSTAYHTNEVSYEQGRKVRGFICVWYKGGKGNLVGRKTTSSTVKSSTTTSVTSATTTNTSKVLYRVKVTAYSGLNVRSGAGVLYKKKTAIPKNKICNVIQEKNGWGQIELGNGETGWISLKYTKKI